MKFRGIILLILAQAFILIQCNHRPKSTDELIARLHDNDKPLKAPEAGDWRLEHPEASQGFGDYLNSNPVRPVNGRSRIYLQPHGEFSPRQLELIRHTGQYLSAFFATEVKILPAETKNLMPDSLTRFPGTSKEQLLTAPIFDSLESALPNDALMIMAITDKDLYPSDKFNFVFGQARMRSRVGVASLSRFWYSNMDSSDYRLCLLRLIKVTSHEMGHMLTLPHCVDAVCVMNGANGMHECDLQPARLCSACLKKIQWNLEVDIRKRLQLLHSFLADHHLISDDELMVNDLASLN